MNIQVAYKSYIVSPYEIITYDCRNPDGSIPAVRVGKYCSIAKECTFILANHLMDRITTFPAPRNLHAHGSGNPSGYSRGNITIGNDVWVGTGCTIMDGITIGDGAVCAARAVVTKSVPPYAIVGGNPARIIRYRFSEETIRRLQAANIWALSDAELDGLDLWTDDIEGFLASRGV